LALSTTAEVPESAIAELEPVTPAADGEPHLELDGHHLVRWMRGGKTVLPNLAFVSAAAITACCMKKAGPWSERRMVSGRPNL
jgi:hypothetical protein